MAFIEVPNGYLVVLHWTHPDFAWTNHVWYYGDNLSQSDQQQLAGVAKTAFDTYFDTYVSEDVLLDDVTISAQDEQGLPEYSDAGAGKPGLSSGEMFDPSLCLLVTLRTNLRGRSYRGRVYLSGLTETHSAGGLWDADAANAALSMLGAMQSNGAALGATLSVCSKYADKVARPHGILSTVQSIDSRSLKPAHQRVRTQRP
jgi:hypothetical protein